MFCLCKTLHQTCTDILFNTIANTRARGQGRHVPVRAGPRVRPCGAARDRDIHPVWAQKVSFGPGRREINNERHVFGRGFDKNPNLVNRRFVLETTIEMRVVPQRLFYFLAYMT